MKLNSIISRAMKYISSTYNSHRIGHIITKGETLEDAQELLFEAMDKVEIVVE